MSLTTEQRPSPIRPPVSLANRPLLTVGYRYARFVLDEPRHVVALSVTAVFLYFLVGLTGPNPNTSKLMAGPISVPESMTMPGWLSYPVTYVAIVCGCVGTYGQLRLYFRGWRPQLNWLFGLGALATAALCLVAPVASSDIGSYVTYGQIQQQELLNTNPYTVAPSAFGAMTFFGLVDADWRDTPTVYGPLASVMQNWVSWLANAAPYNNERFNGFLLMAINGAFFLLVGWALRRYAPDPVRATLLWTASPLMLMVLVSGGHIDTLVVAAGIPAVLLLTRVRQAEATASRWRYALAGALTGVACGIKANAALIGAGLAWERIRAGDRRSLLVGTAAAIAVLVPTYTLLYGFPETIEPVSGAATRTSWLSPWSLVEAAIDAPVFDRVVGVGWPALLVLLAFRIRRALPGDVPELPAMQFALAFAWVLAAPWVLPWYHALAIGWLALLPMSKIDKWVIIHMSVLVIFHNSGWTAVKAGGWSLL